MTENMVEFLLIRARVNLPEIMWYERKQDGRIYLQLQLINIMTNTVYRILL